MAHKTEVWSGRFFIFLYAIASHLLNNVLQSAPEIYFFEIKFVNFSIAGVSAGAFFNDGNSSPEIHFRMFREIHEEL